MRGRIDVLLSEHLFLKFTLGGVPMIIGTSYVRHSLPMVKHYHEKLKAQQCEAVYVSYCDAYYEGMTLDDLDFLKHPLNNGDTVVTVSLTSLCNSVELFEEVLRLFQRRNIRFKVIEHNLDIEPEALTERMMSTLIDYFNDEYYQYCHFIDEQLVQFGRYRFTPFEIEEILDLLKHQSIYELSSDTGVPVTTLETFMLLYNEYQKYPEL